MRWNVTVEMRENGDAMNARRRDGWAHGKRPAGGCVLKETGMLSVGFVLVSDGARIQMEDTYWLINVDCGEVRL